jgi:hypothetical protein
MPRAAQRSAEDETGRCLVDAGKLLVRTGTPIEQLTVSAAAELASRLTNTKITTGSAYPRFGDQDGFRVAVLAAFLDGGPAYSDLALDGVTRGIQELGDGKSDLLEPEDVPQLIAKVAAEHEAAMRNDSELALRLYAMWRLKADGSERAQEQLSKVRERDELINAEWARIVKTLADELEVVPLDDLEYADFEVALTALRNGLLVRQATTGVRDGTLERIVACLILGFFARADEPRKTVRQKLTDFLDFPSRRREKARLRTVREAAIESLRRLSPISDADIEAAENPAVRRALEALQSYRKGL